MVAKFPVEHNEGSSVDDGLDGPVRCFSISKVSCFVKLMISLGVCEDWCQLCAILSYREVVSYLPSWSTILMAIFGKPQERWISERHLVISGRDLLARLESCICDVACLDCAVV